MNGSEIIEIHPKQMCCCLIHHCSLKGIFGSLNGYIVQCMESPLGTPRRPQHGCVDMQVTFSPPRDEILHRQKQQNNYAAVIVSINYREHA